MSDPPAPPLEDPAEPEPNQPAPAAPPLAQIALNWSHFRPEFAGKPEKDAKAHLLCTNDWMNTHNFPEGVKVQRFCLTLLGEARLWYESLRPIENDWPPLQENFRQQYSKIGNAREQLFYVWRSFHYDENAEMVDAYVNRIIQVAAMLGYEELKILEVFKNTIPNRLYWILYPIDNLRVAVETPKRVLTMEKIGRQMSGQSSAMPFMRVSNDNNYSTKNSCKKGVTFDVLETLEKNSDSIDKLTSLVSKMNVKMVKQYETQYTPQVYQGRRRGQNRCKYRQDNYQPRNRSYSRDQNMSYRGRGNYDRSYRSSYRGRVRDNYGYDNRQENYRQNDRHGNYRQNDRRENYGTNYREDYGRDN